MSNLTQSSALDEAVAFAIAERCATPIEGCQLAVLHNFAAGSRELAQLVKAMSVRHKLALLLAHDRCRRASMGAAND